MKKQMYALLDHTAQVFFNPITFTNEGDAIRCFTTVVNEEKQDTNIAKYPESFTLYRLQDYDDSTGIHEPRENEETLIGSKPRQIITGIQVQNTEKQKFSLKDMMNMLKEELQKENIIPFKEANK